MADGATATASVTRQVAAFASALRYEDLPAEVVAVLKRILLDSLGTTLAANTLAPGIPELVAVLRELGGAPDSTILGFGDKVPAPMAAFANGGMNHALNYDDFAESGGHIGASTVGVSLALAERSTRPVSGKELLTAMAAGAEVICRIGAAVMGSPQGDILTRAPNPLRIQLWAYFSASAAAGRLLGLSAEQIHSTFGLVVMQAAGNWQPVLEGIPAKIYTGFPNLAAGMSALMAAKGVRAECAVFEGEGGIFASMYRDVSLARVLVDGLGERYSMLNVRFKPWPTSGVCHPFIEAALELREGAVADPDQIEAVHIRGGTRIQAHCEPVEERKRPSNGASAGDSVFFTAAKALANRAVTLADFLPTGLNQPAALALAERMTYEIQPELGHSGVVEVVMRDGQRHTARVDQTRGHPSRPLTDHQLEEKLLDCARFSARPIPEASLARVVDLVHHLEDASDVAELPRLLAGRR